MTVLTPKTHLNWIASENFNLSSTKTMQCLSILITCVSCIYKILLKNGTLIAFQSVWLTPAIFSFKQQNSSVIFRLFQQIKAFYEKSPTPFLPGIIHHNTGMVPLGGWGSSAPYFFQDKKSLQRKLIDFIGLFDNSFQNLSLGDTFLAILENFQRLV